MRILITGGFGYVGGRLGKHLAQFPTNEIYLGSRIKRPPPHWLRKGNTIRMDWSDTHSLITACGNIDAIIHASGMNASECFASPELALKINCKNTKKLLEVAQKSAVSKFIFVSTAHVYTNLNGIITEDSETCNSHPYATSNLAGEKETLRAHSNNGLQCSVIRLANSFGPPSNSGTNCWILVVNELCRQAALQRRLEIRGPANALRNFISMTDVCSAMEFLLDLTKISQFPMTYNLGDRTHSILDIAGLIKDIYFEKTGYSLPIIKKSKDSKSNNTLDFISKNLELMGYKSSSSFKSELVALVEYCELNFRENYEN